MPTLQKLKAAEDAGKPLHISDIINIIYVTYFQEAVI